MYYNSIFLLFKLYFFKVLKKYFKVTGRPWGKKESISCARLNSTLWCFYTQVKAAVFFVNMYLASQLALVYKYMIQFFFCWIMLDTFVFWWIININRVLQKLQMVFWFQLKARFEKPVYVWWILNWMHIFFVLASCLLNLLINN